MRRTVAGADSDSAFTLDDTLLAQRKAASARRLYTVQIPAVRATGFVVLCLVAALQDWRHSAAFPQPELLWLVGANLSFAALAWLAQRLAFDRLPRDGLSLLLFHLDVLVWLPNLHLLEQGDLFFAYFLLLRVVDQAGVGFRRALYFGNVVTLAYLGYSLWLSWHEPARAFWPDRLGIAAVMYLLALYIALTGLVTERLRNRTRQAVHAAHALVDSLAQKARALESQAAELELARQQAQQASLAKSQFLAVTSHELRTPMNGILGAADLLMGTPLTRTQQRYVQTAHRSATALLALIDDVLDLSRIEAAKLALNPSSVDLRALVDEAVDLIAATVSNKSITLSCSVAEQLPKRVLADPLRLRQLLVNLLDNAVKFTDRGSVSLEVLLLDAGPQAPRLRLSVRDTGIGIAPDQLASVFEAFTQIDSSSTRRHRGSGLGLAVVKELTRLMGGEVGVESRLGEGSHFWIDLPLVAAADAAAPAAPSAADESEAAARVLLVDDDPINQMVVEEMLKMLGCRIDVVGDGEAAHSIAAHNRYDIIFMDCHMPVMDGYQATRRIREHEQRTGRHAAIVALTADSLASDRRRCIESGMDDFMTKPVSSAQLSATIERWTGHRTNPATQW